MSTHSNIPADEELVRFFGVRPKYSDDDPSIPSYYQQLEFESRRGEYTVLCRIQASCGDLQLSICHDSVEIVFLEVSSITGYRLDKQGDTVALVAKFSEPAGLRELVLRLAPVPHVHWGTRMGWVDRPPA